jgi:putative ATP-binding cassette transporter
MMRKFFGALAVGVPVNVMYKFYRQKLSLSWREWLTNRITDLYYANRVYYTLEASKEIDNPDQRIAEDVRAFTRDSLEFFITALTAVIDLVAFSSILFKIYPQLFVAIIAYATIGTLITTTVGRRLVGLNFLQLQREAFFRYSLMRVRENSESIAFYGGEGLELKEIRRRLIVSRYTHTHIYIYIEVEVEEKRVGWERRGGSMCVCVCVCEREKRRR